MKKTIVSPGAITKLEGDISGLSEQIANLITKVDRKPNDLTTDGLTFNNCTHEGGGYCFFGNTLVIIELRIKTSSDVGSWSNLVSGLPHTGGREIPLVAICVSGSAQNGHRDIDVSSNSIRTTVAGVGTNETINISGVYLWRGYN